MLKKTTTNKQHFVNFCYYYKLHRLRQTLIDEGYVLSTYMNKQNILAFQRSSLNHFVGMK